MKKATLYGLLTALFTLTFTCQALPAQNSDNSWDVDPYPEMPYTFNHLDAELRIMETGMIEGDLLYTIRFLDQDADSVVLDAPGVEIARIAINDESAEYNHRSDRLVIYTGDRDRGDEISLRVQYRAEPKFGLHETADGTFWTSMLPKSTSHWLPVKDHPRVEFTMDMVVTHPAGLNVVSNGRMGETEVVSVDDELTSFTGNSRKVTPGGITLVSGSIERLATTSDSSVRESLSDRAASYFQRRSDSHIALWSESSDLDISMVMSTAGEAFARMSEESGVSYPFRDLHIILLDDASWETRPYGSGTLFIFNAESAGSLEEQIVRGVISQWVGASLREQRWTDSSAILLMQAYWLNEIYGPINSDLPGHSESDPYHTYTLKALSQWQNLLNSDDHQSLRRILDRDAKSFLENGFEPMGWNQLAYSIYKNSGRNLFDEPGLETLDPDEEEREEISEYLVQMDWNEDERTVRLTFTALGEPVDELVTVQATEHTFLDEKNHELTFTGESDTIELSVSTNIENLKLHEPGRDGLLLREEKPFEFWIFQLREDEDPDRRKAAARALSGFPENPDLQLALTDMFSVEENSEVYAEIVRSLGAITTGASGTDQLFLDRLGNRYPVVVREAALESLAYFQGNEMVISRLQSVAAQSDDSRLRRAAIRSLREISEPDAFRSTAESLITRDNLLYEVPLILQLLASKSEEEAAVQFSSTFLAEGFPYSVRREVLDLVKQYDESRSGWEDRLPDLLADRDPRIRYSAAEALGRTGSSAREEILATAKAEEHDLRVLRKLNEW